MLVTLGIGFIQAHSPQAKGRIERLWGTLQDRLTSELRFRGLATLDAGNAFLPEFLVDFIPRFAQPAATPLPAWRPVRSRARPELPLRAHGRPRQHGRHTPAARLTVCDVSSVPWNPASPTSPVSTGRTSSNP
jgi:hypothetical protein